MSFFILYRNIKTASFASVFHRVQYFFLSFSSFRNFILHFKNPLNFPELVLLSAQPIKFYFRLSWWYVLSVGINRSAKQFPAVIWRCQKSEAKNKIKANIHSIWQSEKRILTKFIVRVFNWSNPFASLIFSPLIIRQPHSSLLPYIHFVALPTFIFCTFFPPSIHPFAPPLVICTPPYLYYLLFHPLTPDFDIIRNGHEVNFWFLNHFFLFFASLQLPFFQGGKSGQIIFVGLKISAHVSSVYT